MKRWIMRRHEGRVTITRFFIKIELTLYFSTGIVIAVGCVRKTEICKETKADCHINK